MLNCTTNKINYLNDSDIDDNETSIETIDLENEELNAASNFLISCEQGNLEMVKFLFEKHFVGLDQIIGSYEQKNGFICACENGNLEIVKFLFENNCGVNCLDLFQKNGFIYACENGNLEIVIFLMENNVLGINQIDNYGKTGFICAFIFEYIEIILFLCEFGYVPSPLNEMSPFEAWYSEEMDEKINIAKGKRLNDILKIEQKIKNLKIFAEEICVLILEFTHHDQSKENLKKDLFIQFRNWSSTNTFTIIFYVNFEKINSA